MNSMNTVELVKKTAFEHEVYNIIDCRLKEISLASMNDEMITASLLSETKELVTVKKYLMNRIKNIAW